MKAMIIHRIVSVMDKEIKTVANVTRQDIAGLLPVAAAIPLRPEVRRYGLEEANRALVELKREPVRDAKVLVPGHG